MGRTGPARQSKVTTKARGDALERRVERLFERLGYTVERSVFLRDRHGNRSEIDVIARRWLRRPV